jgi:hypothetical protein
MSEHHDFDVNVNDNEDQEMSDNDNGQGSSPVIAAASEPSSSEGIGANSTPSSLSPPPLAPRSTQILLGISNNIKKMKSGILTMKTTQVNHAGRKQPYTNHLRRKTPDVYSDSLRQSYTMFYGVLRSS